MRSAHPAPVQLCAARAAAGCPPACARRWRPRPWTHRKAMLALPAPVPAVFLKRRHPDGFRPIQRKHPARAHLDAQAAARAFVPIDCKSRLLHFMGLPSACIHCMRHFAPAQVRTFMCLGHLLVTNPSFSSAGTQSALGQNKRREAESNASRLFCYSSAALCAAGSPAARTGIHNTARSQPSGVTSGYRSQNGRYRPPCR